MAWEPPAIERDPDEATARIFDGLRERLPGWEGVEGDPLVVLAEEIGREMFELAAVLDDQFAAFVRGLGETVYGLAPKAGIPATLLVDIATTKADVAIPAGLTVIGTTPDGTEVAFMLPEVVIATTTVTRVTMHSALPDASANGVPAAQPLRVATATAVVVGAVSASASSGGSAAEDDETYLDRLTLWLGTLRPGGVTGEDMAVLARSVAGVHRALGVDLYDPATPGVDVERTVTVFPIDAAGAPASTAVAAEVEATLEAAREVNFVVHVAEPTYTGLDVVVTVAAALGVDTIGLQAAVEQAITGHLSPATWGSTVEDPGAWVDTPTVRYLDLASVISTVPGVAHINTLALDGGTVDVTLPGVAPLPAAVDASTDPTTVSVTVV